MNIASVGAGGFLGAIFRYLVGKIIPSQSGFPLSTLVINLLGCLFLAWFFTITAKRKNINQNLILAIGTGFTGAFTTFSTFSVETMSLFSHEQFIIAILYVLISILGGLAFALIGVTLGLFFVGPKRKPKGETE
ncbi:fluoride efflux transporter CrcB [Neobacillus mesonae]|uniref:fluoride efflux transporter CrcB n=1 Tax=Neobacillus mesonae TaxID=1193713 RepID=UPI00203DCDDB|nr:fluoride efflux transporter CrcB [Neobacillus mesonae]MCM3569485.1 fluoride efflux transporter CrcB [Neobacillus mesonae]